MLKARLLRLDDQAHEHTHDHHQLVLSLTGRAEFEVNGRGGEVYFQNLLSYAGAELERYGSDPLLARALGGVLLRALHLRLFGEQTGRLPGGLDLERLDGYIVEHLARRISVAELAQVACLSPSHFHAQFKDSVGLTPHQYLLKTRLDSASRLLRESGLPLIRIAEECGFSSQSALTTAMRRYLGLTPKRVRTAQ